MGFPILDELVAIARTGIDFFNSHVPNILRPILFLLVLAVIGNAVLGLFLDNDYACDENIDGSVTLTRVDTYNQCLGFFGSAWANKHNLSESNLDFSNLTSQEIIVVNETVQNIAAFQFFNFYTRFNPVVAPVRSIFETFDNFRLFNEDRSFETFTDILTGNQDLTCRRLYICLPEDARSDLGLTANCTVNDVPEFNDYIDATRVEVAQNTLLEGKQEQNLFRVACSTLEEPSSPTITFLNVEFLSLKLWIALFFFGTLLSALFWWMQKTGAQ